VRVDELLNAVDETKVGNGVSELVTIEVTNVLAGEKDAEELADCEVMDGPLASGFDEYSEATIGESDTALWDVTGMSALLKVVGPEAYGSSQKTVTPFIVAVIIAG
jgi:hypothetical protein